MNAYARIDAEYDASVSAREANKLALESHQADMIWWWLNGERISGHTAVEAVETFGSLTNAAEELGEADFEETRKHNEKFGG